MKNLLLYLLVLLVLASCKSETPVTDKEPVLVESEIQNVEPDMNEQTAEVRLTVPDSLWSISIEKVLLTQDHIAVIAQLKKSDGIGMMVISEVVDKVAFVAPDLPIKIYVLGKTWNWENSEGYIMAANLSEADFNTVKELVFTRVTPEKPGGPKKQML